MTIVLPSTYNLCIQDPASKDAQMRLLEENRRKQKKDDEADNEEQGDPKSKAKKASKAKAKAKSKAAGKSKARAKAHAKKEPEEQSEGNKKSGKSKATKRPAAAMQQEVAPQEALPQLANDVGRDCSEASSDAADMLPNTFARRAKPTSTTGLLKYAKIVKAFRRSIPCPRERRLLPRLLLWCSAARPTPKLKF